MENEKKIDVYIYIYKFLVFSSGWKCEKKKCIVTNRYGGRPLVYADREGVRGHGDYL